MRRNSCVSAWCAILVASGALCGWSNAVLAADPAPVPAKNEARKAEQKLEQLLERPLTFDFQETPLSEVVDFLKDLTHANILLDRHHLEESGIATDTPITLKAKDIRLRAALHRILSPHGMTFAVRDEALVITTTDQAGGQLATRIHPARDILPDAGDEELVLHAQLLQAAVKSVEPNLWDDVGGPASVSTYRRQLVVNAASETHHQIADLLALLRAARPQEGKAVADVLRTESPQEKKVRAKLDTPAEADFQETPLNEVVAFLADKYELNVALDMKSLADAGLSADQPVTLKLKEVTLRSVLNHLLRDVQLAYHISDDMLVISSPEAPLAIAIYPIGDLERLAPMPQSPLQANVPLTGGEDLVHTIQTQISPQTWEAVGGSARIGTLCSPPVLVVLQTEAVHREIQELLSELREKAAAPPIASKPVEKVYVLTNVAALLAAGQGKVKVKDPMPTAEELASVVRELVDPTSWKEEGFYVKPVTGRLIVRHHPATHRKIEKLLTELNVVVPQMGGGFGGNGMGGGGMGGGGLGGGGLGGP